MNEDGSHGNGDTPVDGMTAGGAAAGAAEPGRDPAPGAPTASATASVHQLLDALPIGVHLYRLEDDGTLVFTGANPAAARILGFDHGPLAGLPIEEAFPNLAQTEVPARYREIAAAGGAWSKDEIVYRDERVAGAFQVHAFRIGQREMAAAFVDVSAHLQGQAELFASRERYRSLAEALPDAIFIVAANGRLSYVNPTAAAMIGVPAEALLGRSQEELFPTELAAEHKASIETVFAEGRRVSTERLTRLGTREVWLENRLVPLWGRSGAVEEVLGISRDITDRRTAEERLRQAQRIESLGRLAGGIAHDFNNVLQALSALSSIMSVDPECSDGFRRRLRELDAFIERGARLTRQLLLFSRRDIPRLECLDLNEIVTDSVRLLERLIPGNITIVVRVAAVPLPVEADRGQLEQVVVNLAVNAADAMADGGTLTISTGVGDEHALWLEVSDTGRGIPDAIRDRIFEPFFTTKSPMKGTGIGLSVVHGIVTARGGTVAMRSEPGHGSTFTVTLPRCDDGRLAAPRQHSPGAVPRGSGERVLVIEDENVARESLAELIQALGYAVTTVPSGEAAVALPPDHAYDLLLVDLMLPGMPGSDTAMALCLRWPGARVIFMSGYSPDEAVRTAAFSGFTRFLQKPFDMSTLAVALRSALDET